MGEADYDIQKLKEITLQNTDSDLRAQYLIYQILSNYKNDPEALEIIKACIKFGSKDYYPLLNAGYIVIYQKLVKAFDKVLELNPDDEYALSTKGLALFSLE